MWPGPYGDRRLPEVPAVASLDQSLKRMGLDYVDIFYSHRFDPDTPLEETMGALDAAVRSGKALYVGISSYSPELTRDAAAILRRPRHAAADPPAVVLDAQPLDRDEGCSTRWATSAPAASRSPRWPRGCSPTSTSTASPRAPRASQDKSLSTDLLTDEALGHIRALNDMARDRGQTLAQMALAWALRDRRVTSVLVGASSA